MSIAEGSLEECHYYMILAQDLGAGDSTSDNADTSPIWVSHFMLLWVDSSGNYDTIHVQDWPSLVDFPEEGWFVSFSMITNADQGIVLTWRLNNPIGIYNGMAVTTGTSASVVGAPSVPGQVTNLVPVLQAQHGSFVGTAGTGDPNNPQNNMVAFDASGNVRWVVPNDQPQIATADSGVIGQSGTTYDQNGNATGQLGSLPTYSWKGAYTDGPVQSIVSYWWDFATSFWAALGGNVTGNGTAARHQSFALNWCANNSCQLSYTPDQYGGASVTDSNVDFYYQMAQQGSPATPIIELSPSQIAIVQNAALAALKQAFHAFPARVLSFNSQPYTHMVEVSGGSFSPMPGTVDCGATGPLRSASTVWYPCNLNQAQWALNLYNTDLSAATGSPNFTSVLWSIGEGIGNTAAHEIAHQYLINSCGMNDLGGDPAAYDAGNADTGNDPSMYTGAGPNGQPLYWTRQPAICLVNQMLWGNFTGIVGH